MLQVYLVSLRSLHTCGWPPIPSYCVFLHAKPFMMGAGERKNAMDPQVTASGEGGRGALVVVEGCDRTGKTTQTKKLVEFLSHSGKPTVYMRFPDRSTLIGGVINSYLTKEKDLDDHAIHLLFSANRWELLPQMMSHLKAGTSVIIDRYAFSGVAFSASKPGLSLEWCKKSDTGLPQPDLVLFLDLTPAQAEARGGYGSERYETLQFQAKVRENYYKLMDDTWKVVNADKSIEELQEELRKEVLEALSNVSKKKIESLWV